MKNARLEPTFKFQHLFLAILTVFALLGVHANQEAAAQQLDSLADSSSITIQDSTTIISGSDTLTAKAGDTLSIPVPQPKPSDSASTHTKSAQNSDSTITSKQSSGQPGSVIREIISLRKIALALFTIIVIYVFNLILVRLLDTFSERFSSYRLFTKRLIPILRIVIWLIAFYVILEGIFDPPLETIIAVAASLGIAIGFASQDILKNIFGGIMIILDRPFQVGDKIQVDQYYGEVTRIGLRSSRIVTKDDSSVAIPNAEIMNKAVSNTNSGALDCQVVAEIFLPVGTNVALVKEIAKKAAYASKYVYLKKPVAVIVLNEMHERQYVIKLRVKAYVFDIRYEFPFKSDLTERILLELDRYQLNTNAHNLNDE